ncbi:MAG TPA: nuclear transport factor 2 family protein [Puia sp.]|nr:nuclear transport factor 2 family protein [Puia sp.]
MKKLLSLATGCCFLLACTNQSTEPASGTAKDTISTTRQTEVPQSEFADARYTEMGKKGLAQLSSGDMAGWMDAYADNAIYRWSSGDSLVGKKAISDYWTNRRSKVIDTMEYANDIWLPVKVNRSQRGPDAPGIWLLGWYQVTAKYKNGKKLTFWVHTDLHYDKNDKIDQAINYIDRAPINKALGQ